MRKKSEYRDACGGDEWQEGVWGKAPMTLFPFKDTPLLAGGFFIKILWDTCHPLVSMMFCFNDRVLRFCNKQLCYSSPKLLSNAPCHFMILNSYPLFRRLFQFRRGEGQMIWRRP